MHAPDAGFGLGDDVADFRGVVARFATTELEPHVEAAERDEALPAGFFRWFADAGLLGLGTSEANGGLGGGLVAQCVLVEETGRVCSGFATSLIVQLAVVPGLLENFASEEHRVRWLPRMVSGEAIGSLAVTEPGAGSDVRSIAATARPTSDGFEISGSKVFITNGTLADFYIVAAVADPSLGHRGIGLFVVERDNPGLRDVRKMRKVSVRSSDTAELLFESAPVGADATLGPDLEGFTKLMKTFDRERVLHASRALGLSRAAFEAANRYASGREQFGRPIREFQAVAFKLADMDVAIEASRLLVYRAATLADEQREFHREASIAKLFATESARDIATESMQIHGSYGLTAEFPVGRFVADAHLETIGTGTSEIQRMIISRALERGT